MFAEGRNTKCHVVLLLNSALERFFHYYFQLANRKAYFPKFFQQLSSNTLQLTIS